MQSTETNVIVSGKTMSKRITCIPLVIRSVDVPKHLTPKHLTPSRWELLPGVWFGKMPKVLKQAVKEVDSHTKPLGFDPNYVIRIDEQIYTKGLGKRLQKEGKTLPGIPDGSHVVFSGSTNLAKHILISLILQQRFMFWLSKSYCFIENIHGSRKTYVDARTYMRRRTEVCYDPAYHLPRRKIERINRNKLKSTVKAFERYFSPYIFEIDRLSVALSNLWNALVSSDLAQTYVSLTIIFEALLSTRPYEITHMLSERAAILIGRSPTERIKIYEDVKELYRVRSKILHGGGVPKKGPLKRGDSLVVSTKFTTVPFAKLTRLADLSFRLIEAAINDPELMSIIHSNKAERGITDELHPYYTKKLLSR